jgi:hypothetical protein
MSEIVIYGKPKLMTTAQCPVGVYAGEKGAGKHCRLKNNADDYYLKDRTGVLLPVITNCNECLSYIYNDRPVLMLSKTEDLLNAAPKSLRLAFTNEDDEETTQAIALAVEALIHRDKKEADRLYKKYLAIQPEFTYGHYYKGAL